MAIKERGAALALAALLLAGAEAGAAGKPAWKWTVEERLAARFDPEARKARAEREKSLEQARESIFFKDMSEDEKAALLSPKEGEDEISGRSNPELFLPSELFRHLLSLGFAPEESDPTESRRTIERRAAALGFGSDLWSRLEKVAMPVLKIERERFRRAMAQHGRPEAKETKEEDRGDKMNGEAIQLCRLHAQALEASKTEFGEEAFLRLLYEAVAPSFSIKYVDEKGLADRLRSMEGGCR